ncbi:uncharacterized protein BO95DRAFT_370285 [Aspergillus brunneoviolaceus CBS 621.78]|uniref:Uncharacterized protein n=1 Tax=Aspergillus brunneoviolaceus CBS 621.78 TaxID=1450534 RepID=A0ACD1G0F9_9EURO|nr:hypothetical protein BO95DRAFT_370285 [Aspergillus brunneoviolaceus CBS 621.78]RAH42715.1 hypothetical protein BO95DRAFT_370285 [Aspergillus brunneoviolaceus CBS 621.78]
MRRISSYFKRPVFAATNESNQDIRQERPAQEPSAKHPSPAPPQSSPLTEVSSSFFSKDGSSTPERPAHEPLASLTPSIHDTFKNETESDSSPSPASLVPGSSFNFSQRVVKHGKEVVMGSDGEDTDSIGSLESPADLFMRFAKPTHSTSSEPSRPGRTVSAKTDSLARLEKPAPSYKNNLDSLVTAAVDDQETEAGIAKLRASFDRAANESTRRRGQLHEGILTSALGDNDDEMDMQRLLHALRRTDAFDPTKAWHFFDFKDELPPVLEFPVECISPRSYLTSLTANHSRERAFHSGIVDFALSRSFLPDEVISWIFHSIPIEPQDSIRHAYCRAIKNTNAKHVKALIRPDDFRILFKRLGAIPNAIDIHEQIVPDADPKDYLQSISRHQGLVLSVLDLICGAADLFADDTREYLLSVLFRMTLDVALTSVATISSEIERAIVTVLESSSEETAEDLIHRVCTTTLNTFKDATFQSRLLKHILPEADWIALIRCRLAVCFLLDNPAPLCEPLNELLSLTRITDILKRDIFDIRKYKGKDKPEYDYGELLAITSLLNIAVDSGRYQAEFADREAEKAFNTQVDMVADRLKKVFSLIEDSGASHLKRTLAKEALETLHYRIVYSVRTRPRPKKSIYGTIEAREYDREAFKGFLPKIKASAIKAGAGTEIPIRQHEAPPR